MGITFQLILTLNSTFDTPKQQQKNLLFDFAAVFSYFDITFTGWEEAGIPLSLKDKRWNLHPLHNSFGVYIVISVASHFISQSRFMTDLFEPSIKVSRDE